MPRYIDADEFRKRIDHYPPDIRNTAKKELRYTPTADVVERKKGVWINRSLNILYPEWERYTCSVCGKHSNGYDFCPHCGADMRGEENE